MALTTSTISLLFLLIFYEFKLSIGECNLTTFTSYLDTTDYDRLTASPEVPLNVQVSFEMRHASIYEKDFTVHVLADIVMRWNDSRLAWNSTDLGCNFSIVSAERLWLPDIVLLNPAATVVDDDENRLHARISSNGELNWPFRLDATVPVTIDLTKWPRDVQICTLRFGSREHGLDEMDLEIGDDLSSKTWTNGNWLVKAELKESVVSQGDVESRRELQWTLFLQRNAEAHVYATSTVFAATLLLLLAAGLTTPASRPAICAAASFTSAIWLISAMLRLPPSASTPLAMQLMCATCICGAVTCLLTALSARVARRTSVPPRVLHSLLKTVSRVLKLTPQNTNQTCASGSGAWVALAKLLDYTLFAVLALTLFVICCIYVNQY